MSNDVLTMKSITDAHKEVQKSSKMKLFKALPNLTLGLIGASIALAQPGKVSAKAASGLGFLALSQGLDTVKNISENIANKKYSKEEDTQKRNKASLKGYVIGAAGLVGAATLAVYAFNKTGNTSKVKTFIQKEARQLADEIDSTKIAKFFDKTVRPFAQKHSTLTGVAKIISPVALLIGGLFTQKSVANSLSNDLKEKATANFLKGKEIQQIARAEYEAIDAQEI